jgi:hypothetical protein
MADTCNNAHAHAHAHANANAAPSVHPFKVINNKTKQNVELYGKDYDAQLELCSDFVRLAFLRETCRNRVNSQEHNLTCRCFSLLNIPLHGKAVGLWMVDFNKLEKEVQQCTIIEKIRHADDLDKIAAENRKRRPKLIYHLPFIMPTEDDDTDDDDNENSNAISMMNGHCICQSALMELIGV